MVLETFRLFHISHFKNHSSILFFEQHASNMYYYTDKLWNSMKLSLLYNDSTQNKRNHIPFWLSPRWLGGRCVIHRADIWNSYCSECCSTPASSCSLSADFHKVSEFWGCSCILLQIPEYSRRYSEYNRGNLLGHVQNCKHYKQSGLHLVAMV